MNIRPLGDRVLVEPVEEKEQTVGGIIIPDSAKEKPMQGKVLAVGKKLDKDGKEIAFDVKKGDTVLLPKYGGTEIKLDGKKLQLVREEDLLGVLENMGVEKDLKHQILSEAQKSTNYGEIIQRLKSVKNMETNFPHLNPSDDYLLERNTGAIILGKEV